MSTGAGTLTVTGNTYGGSAVPMVVPNRGFSPSGKSFLFTGRRLKSG